MSHQKPVYVFVDRDGTLNLDTKYLLDPKLAELLPGVAEAVGHLKRAGFSVVVVSSQSAIGRGMGTHAQVESVNRKIEQLLIEACADAQISDWLYCPHAPTDGCECRKPKGGLVRELLAENPPTDIRHCWVVGDKVSDVKFGVNLGLPIEHCLLIGQPPGGEEFRSVSGMADAATIILAERENALSYQTEVKES